MKKFCILVTSMFILFFSIGSTANAADYWCKSNPDIPAFSSACSDNKSQDTSGFLDFQSSEETNNTSIILVAAVLLLLYINFICRWAGRKAKNSGYSYMGFAMLMLIFPVVAWPICLLLKPKNTIPNILEE